jgi:hypothetical protein
MTFICAGIHVCFEFGMVCAQSQDQMPQDQIKVLDVVPIVPSQTKMKAFDIGTSAQICCVNICTGEDATVLASSWWTANTSLVTPYAIVDVSAFSRTIRSK